MTSYFYAVRFFKSNMIPFSTALYDPKWYHDNGGFKHIFFDKNLVVNGLRAPMFTPPEWCRNACRGYEECPVKNPNECAFLKAYEDYVNTLKAGDVVQWLTRACEKIKLRSQFEGEPIPVLLFHEKPDNPCSERVPVVKWLDANGINGGEFVFK